MPNETNFEEEASPQHVLFLGRHLDKGILPQTVFLSYLTNSSEKFLNHTVHAQRAVRKCNTINYFLIIFMDYVLPWETKNILFNLEKFDLAVVLSENKV